MLVPFVIASLVAAPLATCPASPPGGPSAQAAPAATDSTLAALYAGGETFARFLAAADERRLQWERTWERATVAPDVLVTAKALKRRWRLLVIAVDGCSDSVNTIPYLARLESLAPMIGMRIIDSAVGRAQMESHRTPDGRPATPTVLVLDEAGNEVGCWVERPARLQAMAVELRGAGRLEEFQQGKQDWYDRDAGASTVREVVEVLAAAEAGAVRCDARR